MDYCDFSPVRVAVVGGGAAGMMAAVAAANMGADVTLFERNERLGKKLRITGKGRCNVTNDCDRDTFLANVPTNPRFLYSALAAFTTADTKAYFENLGVPLKTERGNRVFPESDKAIDIVNAMKRAVLDAGVKIINERVSALVLENDRVCGLRTGKSYEFDRVIVCTGGKSYPLTGSDGDGYRLALQAGHTVTPLIPSLVPITCEGKDCRAMQGLSLRNVGLTVKENASGKVVYRDFGEMMFTHFGLTGPMILSASAHLPDIAPDKYTCYIDLKPALDEKMLDARLLSDFSKYQNKDFINSLGDLLPQKMIDVVVERSGIDPRKKVNSITAEQRHALVALLKGFSLRMTGFRPIDEAIVTKGGVDVKQVKPASMESRLVSGLYFAGEVLDVDAYTGGFNLQIAFSTGHLAGESAATD
ncbi:MAG: NAD(P)/FAD-dependent oxidoreductase [Ruminococcaceae bacterium]|nr:NAD(P)/FAD-dependent oxidoreductase [Oscillospiraceae bacterium]